MKRIHKMMAGLVLAAAMAARAEVLSGFETKLAGTDTVPGDQFGSGVALYGDTAAVGSPWAAVGGLVRAGAVYVFSRNAGGTNAWGQATKLTASDTVATNEFGEAVALDGDVLAVGARFADGGGLTNAGAVYIFERVAGTTNGWREVGKRMASDAANNDFLGAAVAVQGDVVAAGATAGAGAVYVFERNTGGTNAWGQAAKLVAADSDAIGTAVDVDGDVIIAGDAFQDFGPSNSVGAAYVFERNAGGTNAWGRTAKLVASDAAPSNFFGAAVAARGDVIVVGAYQTSPGGVFKAGAAYVFHRNAGGINAWGEVARLTASDAAAEDRFGYSVAVEGDVIAVGAHTADPNGVESLGATYLFQRNAGGTNAWARVARLTAADRADSDELGISVAVDGDLAAAGAHLADVDGEQNAGAVYLFQRNTGGTNEWDQVAKLVAADVQPSEYLGRSVAVDGDTVLAGAPYAVAQSQPSAGAVCVFDRSAGGTNAWGQVARLEAGDPVGYAYFGYSVSLAGDTAFVGAPYDDAPGTNDVGALYVFQRHHGGSNAWGQVAKIVAPSPGNLDRFGASVGVDGQFGVAGAPGFDVGSATNCGAMFVIAGSLFGAPAITGVARSNGAALVSFPAQPAWRYDVESASNLLQGSWSPAGGLTNLAGETDGAVSVAHTNPLAQSVYRIVRREP